MSFLIGEYECKLDTKGRMVLPAALKRQMPDVEREGLVVNRGFEKHLVIYTREEWNAITESMAKLNQFDPKVRAFVRGFTRGATELSLDAAGRVLLPKGLLEFAEITGELVLACQFNKIEVWSKSEYDLSLNDVDMEDFSSLAAEVMKGSTIGGV